MREMIELSVPYFISTLFPWSTGRAPRPLLKTCPTVSPHIYPGFQTSSLDPCPGLFFASTEFQMPCQVQVTYHTITAFMALFWFEQPFENGNYSGPWHRNNIYLWMDAWTFCESCLCLHQYLLSELGSTRYSEYKVIAGKGAVTALSSHASTGSVKTPTPNAQEHCEEKWHLLGWNGTGSSGLCSFLPRRGAV